MIRILFLAAFSMFMGGLRGAESVTTTAASDASVERLLGRQFIRDMKGSKAKNTIRGTRALWIDIVVQKPEENAAFKSLELDLKSSDMEGQLRNAGFKVMDPKKRSLAIGLRPTLVLMVLRSPAGADGNEKGFYVVVGQAMQDVTPLGGETFSTPTWAMVGETIAFSGDEHKDIDSIRVSARAVVKAFIDTAHAASEDGK